LLVIIFEIAISSIMNSLSSGDLSSDCIQELAALKRFRNSIRMSLRRALESGVSERRLILLVAALRRAEEDATYVRRNGSLSSSSYYSARHGPPRYIL